MMLYYWHCWCFFQLFLNDARGKTCMKSVTNTEPLATSKCCLFVCLYITNDYTNMFCRPWFLSVSYCRQWYCMLCVVATLHAWCCRQWCYRRGGSNRLYVPGPKARRAVRRTLVPVSLGPEVGPPCRSSGPCNWATLCSSQVPQLWGSRQSLSWSCLRWPSSSNNNHNHNYHNTHNNSISQSRSGLAGSNEKLFGEWGMSMHVEAINKYKLEPLIKAR